MSIRTPQNPGIGGLDELTNAEEAFVTNLAGLAYTQGDILYHDGTDLTVDNANLFWDDTNKRLGIGTTTPAADLHVDGFVKIGAAELVGGNAGFLNVELRGDEPYTQAIKMIADRDGQAVLYGFNGTAIGNNTKNVGLYGWASGATTNLGLWIDNGDALFDEDLIVSGQVGIGTSTPDTKLQVVGDTKLGDDNTNYALFASDGELTLTGTARVVRHLRVGAGSLKLGASSPTAGLTGVFPHLSFAHTVNQEAHFQVIVPHRWDTSTDIEICFDWLYTGAQDNGTVKWGLEYNSIKEDEDPTTGSVTISNASPGTHTTGKIVRTCLTDMILASNLEAEDTFGVRLFRDQANDTLGTGAILIGIHFHMIQNKLGKAT